MTPNVLYATVLFILLSVLLVAIFGPGGIR